MSDQQQRDERTKTLKRAAGLEQSLQLKRLQQVPPAPQPQHQALRALRLHLHTYPLHLATFFE
jgi:hypothetical protein